MRIGIDMRMAGTGEGIARYSEELVKHLSDIDTVNDYFLIFQKNKNSRPVSNPKFKNVFTSSKYYSWAEQTKFIFELAKLKLDLVHFPSFNVPIFYPGKFVVTIHDMIHHFFPGKKKARFFHRWAYRLTMKSAIGRAAKIIAVSKSTRDDILKHFPGATGKTATIYEGVGQKFKTAFMTADTKSVLRKFKIEKPYILFVGVWRQYKNLPRLAEAFEIIKTKYGRDCQLVLAGKIDEFYPEIKNAVMNVSSRVDIITLGFVDENDLVALYKGAEIFAIPSLVEGFGLIAVEAQTAGIAVAASDIAVMREILGGAAVFFNPESAADMAEKIAGLLADSKLRNDLAAKGRTNAARFDWRETARQTLKIYQSV